MILIAVDVTLKCHKCGADFSVLLYEDGTKLYECPGCGEKGACVFFDDVVIRGQTVLSTEEAMASDET